MRVQMIAAAILCTVLSVVGIAAGLLSLDTMQATTDPREIEAAQAYAIFWLFLGAIGTIFGILAYRLRNYRY